MKPWVSVNAKENVGLQEVSGMTGSDSLVYELVSIYINIVLQI